MHPFINGKADAIYLSSHLLSQRGFPGCGGAVDEVGGLMVGMWHLLLTQYLIDQVLQSYGLGNTARCGSALAQRQDRLHVALSLKSAASILASRLNLHDLTLPPQKTLLFP